MVFEIKSTEKFQHVFDKLETNERNWIYKVVEQLKQNPFQGKPGYKWFREKKLEGNRLYYLIYSNQHIVLLAAYDNKKEQSEIIAYVLAHLAELKKLVKEN